eukprot:365750-Chlamydomonas_euryale.AAC.2
MLIGLSKLKHGGNSEIMKPTLTAVRVLKMVLTPQERCDLLLLTLHGTAVRLLAVSSLKSPVDLPKDLIKDLLCDKYAEKFRRLKLDEYKPPQYGKLNVGLVDEGPMKLTAVRPRPDDAL